MCMLDKDGIGPRPQGTQRTRRKQNRVARPAERAHGGYCVLKSVSELQVVNWPPAAKKALVAGLPVGIVGLHEESGFDLEIQAGFVSEVDADAVVAEFGGEFHAFNDFAFGLGKAKDFPEPVVDVLALMVMRGASVMGLSLSKLASLKMTS